MCLEDRFEDKRLDHSDRMMDEFDRVAFVCAKAFFLILLGVALGYAWRMAQGF